MEIARSISRRDWLGRVASAGAVLGSSLIGQRTTMAADDTKLRIIDPHVHVWKNDARYPWPADLAKPPSEDALPETLLGLMQANGVEKTVIVHVIYYRWDCRYAADCVNAHPDKFMGVCRVDPQSAGAAAELERWTRAGYHGVRLSPFAGPASDWIADRTQMDAIWGKAAELKIPICILCDTARLPDVAKVVERFADRVDVCIDHMADCAIDRPAELDKLLALARYPRVFVKLSHLWLLSREPYPYRDTHTQVRRLYDAFGPQRLMWGTDWPAVESYCEYGRALALYRDEIKFFTDDDRRWILGGTALRL